MWRATVYEKDYKDNEMGREREGGEHMAGANWEGRIK